MGSLDGLEVFVAICEAGSIAGAGRALDMPRATLSRQLARLEDELGVRLLHRSTRRLVRTPAGDELYARAARVVEAARAAREAVRRLDDVPRGRLRVSVPPDIGPPVTDVIMSFARRFPKVDLMVEASSTHVDLVADGFDVALRGGRVRDPDLVARRLVHSEVHLYATPAYLDARGRPAALDDLAQHDCITLLGEGGRPQARWPLFDGGSVEVEPRVVVNTMNLALDAARNDLGIAPLPAFLFGPALESLERVLPDQVGTSSTVSLVVVERALMLPRVRAFLDHMVAGMERVGTLLRE